MTLDDLKLKRLYEARSLKGRLGKTRRLVTDAKGRQVYATGAEGGGTVDEVADEEKNASNQSGGTLGEGKKSHHTPKFVQHCVSAITEKPESLNRVEAGGPKGEKGSPFAICHASYKKKTRSKAAAHSKGEHHSVKQYEKSLATLREDVERAREESVDRRAIFFSDVPQQATRRHIRFTPRG